MRPANEVAGRLHGAIDAVREFRDVGIDRAPLILGIVEAVRDADDYDWYYVVLVDFQRSDDDYEFFDVWFEKGRWIVVRGGNELTWNGGVVGLMAHATRLR